MSQHQLTIEEPVGLQDLRRFGFKYFIKVTGNPCGVHKEILNHLHKQIPELKKKNEVNDCDVILVFCPIVSRAGTDIQAALSELNECSESKPAVFMVLHHTFEREKILPDSSRYINRKNTLTVNLLFNEDDGIITCDTNHEALTKIIKQFQSQKQFLDNYICRGNSFAGILMCWLFPTLQFCTILWHQIKRLCSSKIVVVILIFGACLLYYTTIEQAVISQDNTGILEEAEKPNTIPLRTFSSENAVVFQNTTNILGNRTEQFNTTKPEVLEDREL